MMKRHSPNNHDCVSPAKWHNRFVHQLETEAFYYRKSGHLIEIRFSPGPPLTYQVFFDGVKVDEFQCEEEAFRAVHITFDWPKDFAAPQSKNEWTRGLASSAH